MDSYEKTTWRNGAAPALSAENLNNIEEGIEDVTNEVINLESKMMSVKDISRSELDSATDPHTMYRVLMPEFGRNANVICVNYGGSLKTQYFFDTFGTVRFRVYTQDTDQWSDLFEIGTGNNIQDSAVFTQKIADKAVTIAKLGDDVIDKFVDVSTQIAGLDLQGDISASALAENLSDALYNELQMEDYAKMANESKARVIDLKQVTKGQYYYSVERGVIGIKTSKATDISSETQPTYIEAYTTEKVDEMLGSIESLLSEI